MSFRGNNIFTDTESEDDYNNVNSTARSISPSVSNVSSNSNSSSNNSSNSSSSSSSSESSESSDEVAAIPSLHSQSTQHLQETTDDENALSLQSSPSPYASDMEEIEQPTSPPPPPSSQRQKKQQLKRNQNDNYLDPDLYCLRRSNRQKDKASTPPEEESEEMTYTTDEEVQESSSDDDYGKSFSTTTHNRKRSSTRQKNNTRSKQSRVIYESDDDDEEEEEESSSDDDEWGSTKSKTKRSTNRSKRLRQRNTGTISPSDFARHSTRSRKVTNYNEDNAELWGLSDDDVGTGDSYTPAPAEEEEGEVIEAVLDHRKREGYESEADDPETNIEYLIKWKTWSHLHDTWDNYEYLRSFKGFRKLENYIRNRIIEEQSFRSHSETTKEEIEQQDINIARRRDEIQDWRTVERITAARGSPPDIEYFVKWKRLHYNECTWEAADVIAADYQTEIDEFLEREQNVYIPHKSTSYPKGNRPDFVDFKTQPAFISGGELRDYQLLGVNWMYYLWCRNENGILADEMGLGKTVQTISFLNTLYHHRNLYGPFLIVVPLSTSDNWMQEFKQWAPQMNVICYLGNRPAREAIRNTEFYLPGTKRLKFNVVITTYEIVLKDKDVMGNIRWQYLAVDEAHRLKNADSQLYEALSSFHTTNRLLITGTPLQNNIKELLALVRFLMPNMDLSQYQFDLDVADVNQEEKIKAIHGSIKSLMLRRLKKDVEKSLPNKSERILRVEMSELQKTYYKHILAKNFDLLSSGTENKKQWLNIAIELKKASNHPFLFPDVETPSTSRITQLKGLIENSGKMVLLDQLLTRLKTDGHRVLIFSQLVMMLDILSDYMTLRGHPFQRLDGSMKPEDRNKAIEHYNSPGSPDFVFLLSTRAGGMGINLVTADTVIIFDSDWNPQNDLQAMSRAHRIGQTKSVNVYRFVTKGTMEEDIIERAKRKMILEYCVIKQMDTSGISLLQDHQSTMTTSAGKNRDIPFNRAEMSAVLKFGAKNMFEQPDNTETLKDIDLDDILSRAEHTETLEGEGSTLGSEDFLAQFKITDYGGTANDLSWDDIIPTSERAKIEEEQQLEDQAAMFDRAAKKGRITYSENNVDEDEELRKTKKRRRPTASGTATGTSSKRRSSNNGKPDELIERDRRAIVRAVLKYGDVEARYAEAVSDSDLEHKDKDVILALYMDLISHCKEKVREQAEAHNTIPKGSQPTEEMLLRELRHTKQKAILFTWRDIQSVNAGQILQRHHDMKILACRLNPLNDKYKFRVSLGAKRVQGWSCAWGPKEDSMLLVGVHKHGFGSWPLIQADTPLGFSDKFFIGDEDKKTPKAIHLVRRAEQMMKILAEEEKLRNENTKINYRTGTSKSASNTSLLKKGPRSKQQQQKERQEAHQSSQQHYITKLPTSTNIKSPMATHHHDASSSSEAVYTGSSSASTSHISKKRKSRTSDTTPRPSGKRAEKENKVPERTYESYDEDSAYSSMRPIKHILKRLRDDSDKAERAEKAQIIKDCMVRIGRHIDREVAEHPRNDNLKRDLWLYTLDYWPGKNITLDNLILVYEKIVAAVKSSSTTATTTTSSTSHQSESNSARDHHHRSSNYSHSSNHYHRSPSPSKNRHSSSRKDSAGGTSSNKRRSSHSYHPYRHDKDENNGHDHSSSSGNRRRRSSSSHRSDDHHRRDRKSYDKYDRDRSSISSSSNKERRR